MKSQHRLEFIDSLRGMAALYVVIFHMALVPEFKPTIPGFLKSIVLNGGTGVTLFFVISAFTLCLTLDGKTHDRKEISYFYIRRILRILPLYYLWMIIMIFLTFGDNPIMKIWVYKWDLLLFSFFGFNFVPGKQSGLVWASWTLGIEMIFYMFFPLIFRWCRNLKKSVYFLGLTLLLAILHRFIMKDTKGYVIEWSLFHHLPTFGVGMLTYELYKLGSIRKNLLRGKMAVCLSLSLFIILPYIYPPDAVVPIIYPMALVYGALILGLESVKFKPLVNRLTIFLGLISYSLYLNHPQLVYNMSNIYKAIYAKGGGNFVSFSICIAITLVPLTLVSMLTYRVIEKPGIDLSRWLTRKMKQRIKPALTSDNSERSAA